MRRDREGVRAVSTKGPTRPNPIDLLAAKQDPVGVSTGDPLPSKTVRPHETTAPVPPEGVKGKTAVARHDVETLMLCIAGAWLYGTISHGRARELARVLGWTAEDVESLKFVEERNKEAERAA